MTKKNERHYFPSDPKKLIKAIGKKELLELYREMVLIRNFEMRAESAYQQGKVGGFFHSYSGQEAIQTAAHYVMGNDQWWITTYRCHALALLLGATPNEIMAELYGKETGNALGRGGSMHLYTDRLLGGFGIVGGHVPIATGAAFTLKYQKKKDQVAICFLGDGAVAQGAFHESLNLASLWDLPCIYVIENNQWGMGTSVEDAISVGRLAEDIAPAYGMKGYSMDGMDLFNCVAGFQELFEETKKTSRPVLVEAVTERFRGHSISDPGLYRTKDNLKHAMERDPIHLYQEVLLKEKILTEKQIKEIDKEIRETVIESMKFAEESPWPDPALLGEGVYADG